MTSPSTRPAAESSRISAPLALVLVAIFATWGLQQVAIKLGNGAMAPIFQASLRSIGATVLLVFWFLLRGERPWRSQARRFSMLALGVLFTLDFGLLFLGLERTSASRGSILYYTTPFFIALGAHYLVPGERLRSAAALGFGIAFVGVGLVLSGGDTGALAGSLVGDLLCLAAAMAWAATILFIKVSELSNASAAATLFYQLAGSAILLPILSLALGEPWRIPTDPGSHAELGFQIVIVASASYLLFFWLLKHHPASKLSAFSFLTPVFGVLGGILLLDESLTATFGAGALLAVAGIALVNKSNVDQG